jgi:hypothetical protein
VAACYATIRPSSGSQPFVVQFFRRPCGFRLSKKFGPIQGVAEMRLTTYVAFMFFIGLAMWLNFSLVRTSGCRGGGTLREGTQVLARYPREFYREYGVPFLFFTVVHSTPDRLGSGKIEIDYLNFGFNGVFWVLCFYLICRVAAYLIYCVAALRPAPPSDPSPPPAPKGG